MQVDRQYAVLAVNGKWIQLARMWFQNNAPCSRIKAMMELAALMPSNIRHGGGKLWSKEQLAIEAHRRLYGTPIMPKVIPALPNADRNVAARNCSHNGAGVALLAHAAKHGTVSTADARRMGYHKTSLTNTLRRNGRVRMVGRGVYEITDAGREYLARHT